jgi:opacity protein-like surface antigen
MNRKAPDRIVFVALAIFVLAASLPAQAALAESKAYEKAGEYLLLYFQNEVMKSPEFVDRFGALDWKDISREVEDSMDFVRDRKAESQSYYDKSYVFIGDILEFEVIVDEIVIDKITGELQKIECEMY